MATADDVINVAAGEIGYYAPNDPADGSKYGRWLAEYLGESWLAGPSDEVWWCMIFVSWVFYHANQSCPGLPSYNTDTTLEAARSAGIVVPASNMARGDIVIMETDSESPGTDHVGIVETVNSSYYTTIEGNTSSSVYSSNCVARKTRYFDGTIAGVIRPPYSGGSTTVPAIGAARQRELSNVIMGLPKMVRFRISGNRTSEQTRCLRPDGSATRPSLDQLLSGRFKETLA